MEADRTWGASLDRWAVVLVFAVHGLAFPFFPDLHSANELSRLYTAWALADGDVEIGPSMARFGDIGDKSRVASSFFSDKPPGTAFLALPGLALKKALGGDRDLAADLRLARLLAGVLPTLVLLLLLRVELAERGVPPPVRALALAAYGLGTLGFTYTVLLYGHQLVAVLVYGTWFVLRKGPVGPARGALAGFLAGLCVATEYQAAVYLVPLAAVFLLRARPLPAALAAGVAGAALPLAALGAYHAAAFGAPWKTGYSYVANPFFANVHAQGFMGVRWPRWTPFAGSLFPPSKGLFAWSPFLLLGFAGLGSYGRVASRGDAVLRAVQVALPVLFVSSMVYWDGGWTVGQRHLAPLVPFLVAPAALLVHRSALAATLAPGLAAASVMMTGTATAVFPHLPENWQNPFHDLVIPLLSEGRCLARLGLGFDPPAAWAWGAAAAAFLVLAVAFVAAGQASPRRKALAVVLLALLPLAWYDGTSRLVRRPPAEAAADRAFFQDQCRAAGRWAPGADGPGGPRGTGGGGPLSR